MTLTPFHVVRMPQSQCDVGTATLLTIGILQSKEGHHHVTVRVFSYIWYSRGEGNLSQCWRKKTDVLFFLIYVNCIIYQPQKMQLPHQDLDYKALAFPLHK